jgi:4-hydroxy-3-methylbut-2-en-1-yl diphosphate reductase
MLAIIPPPGDSHRRAENDGNREERKFDCARASVRGQAEQVFDEIHGNLQGRKTWLEQRRPQNNAMPNQDTAQFTLQRDSYGGAAPAFAIVARAGFLDIAPVPSHVRAMTKPCLTILLAAPRGFCAGVVRAIDIVERALALYGAPVYVRHEIVHNKYVVDDLAAKGAIFVDELDEIPPGDHPVIFSAHGVPKAVPKAASARQLFHIDATCPLVTKVHMEAQRHYAEGLEIILIGHRSHPEVIGTMGQLPDGAIRLIETAEEAEALRVRDPAKLAYVTQTTLSVDDTRDVIAVLRRRFPLIAGPHKEDICYATTNRQEAVKSIAPRIDLLLVVGAPNSSNSKRLVEVGEKSGCPRALLVQRASDLDWATLKGLGTIGLTAGASAPEVLVTEIVDAFRSHYNVSVEKVILREENVSFKLPRELRDARPAA